MFHIVNTKRLLSPGIRDFFIARIAIRLLGKLNLLTNFTITHRLSLDKGEHAYAIFDQKQDGCIKVVLKP